MNRTLLTAVAFILGTGLATASFAQGRHDDRPHGYYKPAASEASRAPVTPGRHDQGPYAHSPRKVVEKQPVAPAGEGAKPSMDTEPCCTR